MSSFLFVVNYIADLKKDVKFTQTCRLTLGFPTEFRLPIMNHLLGSSLQTSKTVEINQVSFDIFPKRSNASTISQTNKVKIFLMPAFKQFKGVLVQLLTIIDYEIELLHERLVLLNAWNKPNSKHR